MKLLLKIMLTAAAMGLFSSFQPAVANTAMETARQMAEDGDLLGAIFTLKQLQSEQPKDADIPKLLGDYLAAAGNNAEAKAAYKDAQKKGNRMATLAMAEIANTEYEVAEARTLLAEYRASLKKGKKVLGPDQSGNLEQRIARTENMLGRVQQIEVIDSMVVDAEDFFTYYRLTPESGSINPVTVLPADFIAAVPTVVYEPESRRQMIWAAPNEEGDGTFALFSTSALYGDGWEKPQPLGNDLGEGGDANYPFLMPDGITLYFANDGDNSLGGLDIFISRRADDGSFLQPQNLGMPYNSPYDDYMLAIDELTGVGWWATDRNRIPGKVTIYVFVPQELRINVDPDNPNLAALARIDCIRDTWKPETDRNQLIRSIMAINTDGAANHHDFEISVPGRGVLTRFDQLLTPRGKTAMKEYLQAVSNIDKMSARLAEMRRKYAQGNSSTAPADILTLEKQIEKAKENLIQLRNEVINFES